LLSSHTFSCPFALSLSASVSILCDAYIENEDENDGVSEPESDDEYDESEVMIQRTVEMMLVMP